MSKYSYLFAFSEDDASHVEGSLELAEPLPYRTVKHGNAFYRTGKVSVEGGADLDLVLYHSEATSAFIYTRVGSADANLLELIGLSNDEIAPVKSMRLPGQLCMGSDRSKLIGRAINDIFSAPPLRGTISAHRPQQLAVFPIAREGLKYQVAEALFENYGYYCDEVVLDAHHVFDSSVPIYNRKVEMTLFKDKDLDQSARDAVSVAFIADSIASGLVLKEVISKVKERFTHLKRVEIVAPLTTIRGLWRIARSEFIQDTRIRLHVFETLLNALPPDYYYSAHFDMPEFHIVPELEQEYRQWWGNDHLGHAIADTACAGYGWSEVFFSPRKQIQMMNDQLEDRHQMSIADIVRRNINH